MWHRLSRCATRTSTVHVLHRITLVSAHDDHALACPCLTWEARMPTRGFCQVVEAEMLIRQAGVSPPVLSAL
jgi:hypothetical protein